MTLLPGRRSWSRTRPTNRVSPPDASSSSAATTSSTFSGVSRRSTSPGPAWAPTWGDLSTYPSQGVEILLWLVPPVVVTRWRWPGWAGSAARAAARSTARRRYAGWGPRSTGAAGSRRRRRWPAPAGPSASPSAGRCVEPRAPESVASPRVQPRELTSPRGSVARSLHRPAWSRCAMRTPQPVV